MRRRQFGKRCVAISLTGVSIGTMGVAEQPPKSPSRSVAELQALAREDIDQLSDAEIDTIVRSHDGPCQCPVCLSSFRAPP